MLLVQNHHLKRPETTVQTCPSCSAHSFNTMPLRPSGPVALCVLILQSTLVTLVRLSLFTLLTPEVLSNRE